MLRRVAVALCAVPMLVRAQATPVLDVGTGIGQPFASAWARESRVAPGLQLVGKAGSLDALGELSERAGGVSLMRGAVDGRIASPAFGRFRLSLDASAASDSGMPMLIAPTQPAATAALSARFGRGGVWLGGTAERGARLSLVTGLWRALGTATFSVTASTRALPTYATSLTTRITTRWDSIPSDTGFIPILRADTSVESLSTMHRRLWSELQARADWSVSRVMLSALVNARPGVDSLRANVSGRLIATTPLTSRVALLVSAGVAPYGTLATGSRRFASVGFRLSRGRAVRPPLPAPVRPVAAGMAVVRAPDGLYRVTLRVPSARTVEITGDFCAWRPVSLRETSPDTWEVTLPLTPGTHRINVRVDGDAWTAPPGVATVDDEFNGRVGVIVVP